MKVKTKIVTKVSAIVLLGGFAASTEHWQAFERFHRAISIAYARVTEFLVEALGLPVYVDGTALYTIDSTIRITRDCNGLVPFVILVSASLLVALPWKRKLAWAALMGTAVMVFNELRIMTYFLINTTNAKAANLFHDMFIPLFLFVIIAGLWLKWVQIETRAGGMTGFPRNKDRVVNHHSFGVWERVSLGLAIALVLLLLMDLLLKGSGILPHCPKNGSLFGYLSVLCLGLTGWIGVVVLFFMRKSAPAALLVGVFTGVHVALFGRLIAKSSFCTTCMVATALSLLVFSALAAQGYRTFRYFTALVVGIGVTQGLYFI